MNEEVVPPSLQAEALETMFMSAGWRVAKQLFAQMAAGHKNTAINATTEMEVVKAVAAMAALERAPHSIEAIAASMRPQKK